MKEQSTPLCELHSLSLDEVVVASHFQPTMFLDVVVHRLQSAAMGLNIEPTNRPRDRFEIVDDSANVVECPCGRGLASVNDVETGVTQVIDRPLQSRRRAGLDRAAFKPFPKPESTDRRREDSGRGQGSYKRDDGCLNSGRLEVGGGLQALLWAPMGPVLAVVSEMAG